MATWKSECNIFLLLEALAENGRGDQITQLVKYQPCNIKKFRAMAHLRHHTLPRAPPPHRGTAPALFADLPGSPLPLANRQLKQQLSAACQEAVFERSGLPVHKHLFDPRCPSTAALQGYSTENSQQGVQGSTDKLDGAGKGADAL